MFKNLIALLLCCPLVLVGCGEEEKKKAEVKPKLVMLTSADLPPFEYFNAGGSNPQLIGFDVDLARRIGTYLGYDIEFKDVEFAAILPGLQEGQGDFAMAGLTPTEARLNQVSFSQPYYFMDNVIVHRIDNDFITRHDYGGVRICVQAGTNTEEEAKVWAANHPGVTILPVPRAGDTVKEVLAGRADGFIMDETPARAFVDKHSNSLALKNLESKSFGSAIAFQKDSIHVAGFNKALNHLSETGELDEMIKKWLTR